jgi:hypothetical protein
MGNKKMCHIGNKNLFPKTNKNRNCCVGKKGNKKMFHRIKGNRIKGNKKISLHLRR